MKTKKEPNIVHIFIPGVPVAKARPRMTRTGHVYTPKKTKDWENIIRLEVQKYAKEFFARKGEPIKMEVTIHAGKKHPGIGIAISRLSKDVAEFAKPKVTRPDIDNYVKAAMDALNGVLYHDDSQIVELLAKKYA